MNFSYRHKAAAAVLVLAFAVTGCASDSGAASAAGSVFAKNSSDKLKIVCAVFPEYDWTKEILGDKASGADITYLLEKGSDLHNYQPSAEDIVKISSCDIFMYVGGESDGWAEDALKEAVNKDMKVINLMAVLGDSAKEEEVKEGMQEEEEHDHHDHHEEDDDEIEYDEHVWLSLKNAEMFCGEIADALCEKDPGNSETYKANLAAYNEKLGALDADFSALLENAPEKTLIFADRFPFRYFTDDYGLDYYAAFVGCSAETEASFRTVTFLAEKTDELNIDTVYTIENSDGKIARSVIENTKNKDQKIAVLDSVQSVSAEQIGNGVTYLGIMQSNYDVLKADLG